MPSDGALERGEAKGLRLQLIAKPMLGVGEDARLLGNVEAEHQLLGEEKLPSNTANTPVAP